MAEHTVVAKCALHGLIYMWDLKSTTKKIDLDERKDKIIEKDVSDRDHLKIDITVFRNFTVEKLSPAGFVR